MSLRLEPASRISIIFRTTRCSWGSGTSCPESGRNPYGGAPWAYPPKSAVEAASATLRDLRIAEVTDLDMQLEDGSVVAYRAKVKVSFKHEIGS